MNLIDEPGNYLTREGTLVQIHEIKGPSTFSAKGHLVIYKSSKGKPRYYHQIWKPNGQFRAHGQHRHDIVSKIDKTQRNY